MGGRQASGRSRSTIRDLRRSCITNWARELPIHVVQQLAGHSDIKTIRQFYLSVQSTDLDKARSLRAAILCGIPGTDLTDPKVTHLGQKRAFLDRVSGKKKTRTPWLEKGLGNTRGRIRTCNLRFRRPMRDSQNGLGDNKLDTSCDDASAPGAAPGEALPADLAVLIDTWPDLPEPVRAGIVAIVERLHAKEARQ